MWPDQARQRAKEADEVLALARRPVVVEECAPGGPLHVRPCPWVRCRYHLLVNEIRRDGSLVPWRTAEERGPGGNPDTVAPTPMAREQDLQADLIARLRTMPETCLLDLAQQGGLQRERLADLLGCGEWAVRDAERRGLAELVEELGEEVRPTPR